METPEDKSSVLVKEKVALPMPVSILSVKIGPNDYSIKIPSNGQFIDIEARKAKLTDGTHSQMLFGGSPSQQAYLLTEVIATLSVLLPKLSKDLNVASMLDLDPIQTKQMVSVYTKEIYPWLAQIRDVANEDIESK